MRTSFLLSALMLVTTVASADPWAIDPAHTRASFSVPHMMVSSVDGVFHDVKGTVDLDEKDLAKSKVELVILASTIDTGNPDRDKHLKSPDFFDVAKSPNITFKSTKAVKVGAKKYKVTGDLTVRDVTKSVTLDTTVSDAVTNPWGKSVRAVHVEGKVSRKDFGLNWNKTLDKGGVLVGDEVTLNLQFELNK